MLKKKLRVIWVGILLIGISFISYTIWDNHRITIDHQTIVIDDLPRELEGFSIVQVSDLHEKQFGNNQQRLIEKINAIDYDAIVFTGDMLDGVNRTNYEPFYTLIEGINNKQHAWFVRGNADPESYQINGTIQKSEFIKGMEQRDVALLESIDTINMGQTNLHVVNFEMAIKDGYVGTNEGIARPSYHNNSLFLDYQRGLLEEIKVLDERSSKDTVVALGHYPVVDARVDQINDSYRLQMRDFDLYLAGHYHGGQVRFPFIGAFFVPEAWYNSSFFPPQDRVKGQWEYKGFKQYVSTGLGTSDAIPFFRFRLFNPSEINVLKLVNGD